jgi:transposase
VDVHDAEAVSEGVSPTMSWQSPSAVSRCGISATCLRSWLRWADVEAGRRPSAKVSNSAELRERCRRNRLLGQQSEVLRRAAAYLSQANLPRRGPTRW